MIDEKLLNTQGAVLDATCGRRVGYIRKESEWFIHKFQYAGFRSPVILPWIRDHTEGRFFLNETSVAFNNEEDYVMFKLGYPYLD